MELKIVCYLAILLLGNAFLGSQTVWSETRETGMDKISLNSLSEKDRKIIEMGEIGRGRYVLGGVVGTYVGLGLGHAIQGRYSSRGWIYTVGEVTSTGLIVVGIFPCGLGSDSSDSSASCLTFTIGMAGYIAFRAWEAVDLWVAPLIHNRKYREIKKKLSQESGENISLFIYPQGKDYIAAGLQIQF